MEDRGREAFVGEAHLPGEELSGKCRARHAGMVSHRSDPAWWATGVVPRSRSALRGPDPTELAHHGAHHGGGVAASKEEVVEPDGRPLQIPPEESRKPPPGQFEGPPRLLSFAEGGADRRLGQPAGDPAAAELVAEAVGAEAAGPALDPLAGKGGIVHVPPLLQLCDHFPRHFIRGAPAPQAGRQVAAAPPLSGEEIVCHGLGGLPIQDSLRPRRSGGAHVSTLPPSPPLRGDPRGQRLKKDDGPDWFSVSASFLAVS